MGNKLILRRAVHTLIALLTAVSLGLMARASAVAWQRYCPAPTGNTIAWDFCLTSLEELIPLVVALGFMGIGLGVWLASRRQLSPIYFLLMSAVLPAGLLSGWPDVNDLRVRVFYFLLAWLVPVTFQFHLSLCDRPLRPAETIILSALYALAVVWTLPILFLMPGPVMTEDWFLFLRLVIRFSLVTSLIMAWMRLWREYRRRASVTTRRHIRLVLFGTLFGFAPFLFLSLLPETFGSSFLPYASTFPWLLLAPLAYTYSLFRYRLARAELALNRAAVYYLLVVALLGLYLAATAILNAAIGVGKSGSALTNALLTVVLVLVFVPLRRGFERLINWVLYGGEINYVGVVQHLAEALSLTLDRDNFRHLLLGEWVPAMRLAQCLLFVRDDGHALQFLGATGLEGVDQLRLSAEGTLATYLEAVDEPVPDEQVREASKGRALDDDEQKLLSLEGVAFWLPLVSAHSLQGLLLVGSKVGVDFFTPEDEQIFATVAHQAGIAAHNVRLMEELRASRQDLEQAHRELLVGRERERQQLAHELHDGAVQQLLGISYQLAANPPVAAGATAPGLRREVLDVVAQLRGLIRELRPAGLGELGLATALEGYVARLNREASAGCAQITLHISDQPGPLPEPVEICLFRVAQEALRNVTQHARARHVEIHVRHCNEHVELEVCDDGRGFQVPSRLGEFASQGHFGLVSIAERAAAVGGRFVIRSEPNAGTRLLIRVPVQSVDGEDGNQDSSSARG